MERWNEYFKSIGRTDLIFTQENYIPIVIRQIYKDDSDVKYYYELCESEDINNERFNKLKDILDV